MKDLNNTESRPAIGQADFRLTGLCAHFSVRKMYGPGQLAVKGLNWPLFHSGTLMALCHLTSPAVCPRTHPPALFLLVLLICSAQSWGCAEYFFIALVFMMVSLFL